MERNQLNLRKSKGLCQGYKTSTWQQIGQDLYRKKGDEGEVLFKVLKKEKLVTVFLLSTGDSHEFLIILLIRKVLFLVRQLENNYFLLSS